MSASTCVAQFNSIIIGTHMLVALGKDDGERERERSRVRLVPASDELVKRKMGKNNLLATSAGVWVEKEG